ncbi:MAG: MFS transporter [Alphaproteobacteria bacterium]|nr:MFS transporter [Alphaproteobacteria bacterium]
MAEAQAQTGRTKIHYGWVVVGMSFVALMVAAGMRSAPTVLIVPLESEFGWSRATISLAIAIQLLLYGLVGPFSAGCIDRFGLRKTLVGALLLMLIGIGFTPFITAPWNLWPLWGVALGSGTGAAAMVMAAVVANRWFVARRGVVMGFLTGSTAAGQLVFLPLLAEVVTHFGWREAVFLGSAIVVATIPLAWLLMRDHPSDVGLRPYGAAANDPPHVIPARINPFAAAMAGLGQGIGHRDFWLLSGGFFVCGASTIGLIGTHFIPACVDHGIPETAAAGILAFMGVFNFIGTTASGWLTDRYDSRYLLFWYYALRGVSLLFLPYAFDLSFWGLTLFGIFYGLDWVATVPPTVRLAANAFGAQNAGMMYGWIMVMHQLGSAAAAYGSGLLHVELGTYNAAFFSAGALCMVAALLSLRVGVGRTPSQKRPALATAET